MFLDEKKLPVFSLKQSELVIKRQSWKTPDLSYTFSLKYDSSFLQVLFECRQGSKYFCQNQTVLAYYKTFFPFEERRQKAFQDGKPRLW